MIDASSYRYVLDPGALRAAREAKGITARGLEKALNGPYTRRDAVCQYELGRVTPRADTLMRMCDVLGVDPIDLMRRVER